RRDHLGLHGRRHCRSPRAVRSRQRCLMAIDRFQGLEHALNAPSHRWLEVTPSNDADLEEVPKFIKIGGTGGTVRMHGNDGVAVTFTVSAGEKLECRPWRVYATGTDVDVFACY